MSEFIDIREPCTGKLLFKFDPKRNLVQIARRGVVTLVDLNQYRETLFNEITDVHMVENAYCSELE